MDFLPSAKSASIEVDLDCVVGLADADVQSSSLRPSLKKARNKITAGGLAESTATPRCDSEHLHGAALEQEDSEARSDALDDKAVGRSELRPRLPEPMALQLSKLEDLLEERFGIIESKLDDAVRLLSPPDAGGEPSPRHHVVAAARPPASPPPLRRRPNRMKSGWGMSTRFGDGPYGISPAAGIFDLEDNSAPSSRANSRPGSKEASGIRCRRPDTKEWAQPHDQWAEDPAEGAAATRSWELQSDRQVSTGSKVSSTIAIANVSHGNAIANGNTTGASRRPALKKSLSLISLNSVQSCNTARSMVERRSALAERLWVFFEEPGSSLAAKVYHNVSIVLIFLSAVVPVVETLPDPLMPSAAYFVVSTAIDAVFLVELGFRWVASPSNLGFVQRPYNIVDIAIVGPLVLRVLAFSIWSEGGADPDAEGSLIAESIVLCTVPVMRLVKALRVQRNFTLLVHTLYTVLEPLCVPLFMLAIISMVFSCVLFVAEPRDNVASVPHAMWLVALTVSTVGYGDVVPTTDLGKVVTCALILFGCLAMAMPIGIVGAAFTETWRNRSRIRTMRRIRDRLNQWGFTEIDLTIMFNTYDTNKDGEIDKTEFAALMQAMRLGLSQTQIANLFNVLDVNCNGSLTTDELLEAIGLTSSGRNYNVF